MITKKEVESKIAFPKKNNFNAFGPYRDQPLVIIRQLLSDDFDLFLYYRDRLFDRGVLWSVFPRHRFWYNLSSESSRSTQSRVF